MEDIHQQIHEDFINSEEYESYLKEMSIWEEKYS